MQANRNNRKIRAVFDTNAVFSALFYGGVPREVTGLTTRKAYRPVMSEQLLTELRRIVSEHFPAEAGFELQLYEKLLKRYAVWVPLGVHPVAVSRDPDGDMVVETAIAGQCDYIISGDKDLLSLGGYEGTAIVTPAEFLERVRHA